MDHRHWKDNDAEYEQWIAEHPSGFVANVNRDPHPRYFRIHRASHRLPDRSNPGSVNPRTGNAYSKVTAESISELIDWAKKEIPTLILGQENFCKTCNPNDGKHVSNSPTSDVNEYLLRSAQILARGEVDRPLGVVTPKVEYSSSLQYFRDPKVRAWVLQRAKGCCELCGVQAPFVTDQDELYLESHHILRLADGGPDTPINTAALCPNCHRMIHLGQDRASLTEQLRNSVLSKEAGYDG